MNKRKPQITITEAERLALEISVLVLTETGKHTNVLPVIINLLDRSKRDDK